MYKKSSTVRRGVKTDLKLTLRIEKLIESNITYSAEMNEQVALLKDIIFSS
jgi:hypothetical protein